MRLLSARPAARIGLDVSTQDVSITSWQNWSRFLAPLGWSLAYLIVGFTIVSAQPTKGAALWYPPIAIGMALLVRYGLWVAPLIFLCDFVITRFQFDQSWRADAIIALNTMFEASLGAWAVRSIVDSPIKRVAQYPLVIFFAGVLSTLIGATTGSLLLHWLEGGSWGEHGRLWVYWFVGDASSVICLLPLLIYLKLLPASVNDRQQPGIGETIALAITILLLLTAACVLTRYASLHVRESPWIICSLPLLWAAVRFPLRLTVGLVALIESSMVLSLWWTSRHVSPELLVPLVNLQIVICVMSISVVTLSHAMNSERQLRLDSENNAIGSARNEQRLQRLLDIMVEGCQIVDRDYRYVYINPTAERFIKRSRQEVVGVRVHDLCADVESSPLYAAVKTCMETGKPARMEHQCVFSSPGTPIFLHSSVQSVDEGVMILSNDITESKRMELEAAKSSKLLRTVVEDSSDCIYVTDIEGRFLLANPATARFLGKSATTIIGRLDSELHTPSDAADIRSVNAEIVKQEASRTWEQVITRHDGKRVIMVITKAPLYDETQRVIGVVGIARDVTDIRLAEKAIASSEARYRAVFDYANDALFVIQSDGLITDANRQACELTGISRYDICGQRSKAIGLPQAADFPVHSESDMPGDVLIVELNGAPVEFRRRLIESDGNTLELLAARNLGPQRKAEELENQHRSQIAHLSRVASVGEIASSLAHELNQPLTAIMSYAGVLQDAYRGEKPAHTLDETREYLGVIVQQAMRAGEIIRSIRRFIQKEHTQLRPDDINNAVRNAMNLLKYEMRDAGVKLVLELHTDMPKVLIDTVQIEQVLINLAHNAIEAMVSVPVDRRSLRVQTVLTGKKQVEVLVADTGPGAPANIEARLFESFFTTKSTGLGLGLAICRSIIESHGGHLNLKSNTINGIVFSFSLPLVDSTVS